MREHGREGYVTGQLLRIGLIDGGTSSSTPGIPGHCEGATGQ